MKITIYTPEEIDIPKGWLPAILKSYQERWDLPKATIDDVADEDILNEAQSLDLIQLPEDWRTY